MFSAKLVDVLSLKPKYDFNEGLQRVDDSYQTLMQLTKEVVTAVVMDSYETLKEQSKMIEYIVTDIAALNQAIDMVQINQSSEF